MSEHTIATAPAETVTPAEQAAAPPSSIPTLTRKQWWWGRSTEIGLFRGPFETDAAALADAFDQNLGATGSICDGAFVKVFCTLEKIA